MISAEIELEIPFHDVDMMEVAWHGHYARYLEIARCRLLDQLNYNYPQMKASGYAWPVIDLHIRYAQPLFFQQRIRVIAKLVEWENRLKIDYEIRDLKTDRRLTRASSVQVAVDMSNREMQFASPEILIKKVEAQA